VLPFRVALTPGVPVSDQVVYAVTKAIVSGRLKPGDAFPSVRSLSQELRINPNTAQRIIGLLVAEGLLEVLPGIGTRVAPSRPSTRSDRRALLTREVEALVVEARRLQLDVEDLLDAVRTHWAATDAPTKPEARTTLVHRRTRG
jgi:DNA-binding transcriptional regulator YhcF (GntR family)